MNEAEDNRELLGEAKSLEQRRIEIVALAIENNVADLLPEPWAKLNEYGRDKLVPISFVTGLHAVDGQRMSERECRNFVSFVGQMADYERGHVHIEEEEDE